jgi:hypothetical protein
MKQFSLKKLFTVILFGIFIISCKKDEKVIPIPEIKTPIPGNNSVNVEIQSGIIISFEHNNEGDQDYTYEIYLDTINQPIKKIKELSKYEYSFNTSDLLAGKTYYWQVVCKNSNGITKESEIWKFTTTVTYTYPPTVGGWSQELVNEIGAKRYTCIDGAVSIGDRVNDLTPFRRITEITKSLSIWSVSFSNLKGLENLKKIGNGLFIANTTNLKSVAELKNIELINGPLKFDNNSNLESISSLDSAKGNITSVTIDNNPKVSKLPFILASCDTLSSLTIVHNPLSDVSELKNLKVVTGKAVVYVLGSGVLKGLEQLKEVKGELALETGGNTDMQNLRNLASVGGDFMLLYSESLISLNGLENLISIGGNLYVEDNPKLTSLSGLDNLNKAKSVVMRNNPNLTEYCALHTLINSQNILWTNFYINSDSNTNLVLDYVHKNCNN